jgi:hypothetical protein
MTYRELYFLSILHVIKLICRIGIVTRNTSKLGKDELMGCALSRLSHRRTSPTRVAVRRSDKGSDTVTIQCLTRYLTSDKDHVIRPKQISTCKQFLSRMKASNEASSFGVSWM